MRVRVRVFGTYQGPLQGKTVELDLEPHASPCDLLRKLEESHGSGPGPFLAPSGQPRETVRLIVAGRPLESADLGTPLEALLAAGQELEVLVLQPMAGGA